MNIRETLKRNPTIYRLNAAIKAHGVSRQTRQVSERYSMLVSESGILYDESAIPGWVADRLASRGIDPASRQDSINIVWVGVDEQQDKSGFLQALRTFGQVRVFDREDGSYGMERPGRKFNSAAIQRNSDRLEQIVDEEYERHGKVDLLLGQMWSSYLYPETLQHIQSRGTITVNISMDDRLPHLWGAHKGYRLGSVGLSDGLDLVLTTSPECCVRYAVHHCPAVFWPLASDPELFKPNANKDIDVCFVGNKYGKRGELVKAIIDRGINIQAYGRGWPNGYATAEKSAELFGRSRIILGIGTVAYNEDIFTLKLRDFDATMAGALYLTHRNPDLLRLYEEGKEIACYSNQREAIDKILYYIENPELTEKIGQAAAEKARRENSWVIRIGQMMNLVGLR